MEENKELITKDETRCVDMENNIYNKVYTIRGKQVMLDFDLAQIYGYEVKRLNEQVKRNINRFPEDFMFQLNREEIPAGFSKSQIATLNESGDKRGRNIKKLPFAFTEQGIYQQATTSIYAVDDYMNTKTLQLLSQKKQGVEVVLFTENRHGRNGFLTPAIIKDFKEQYPILRIKPNPDCHDRWIILDYNTQTEQVYHCGASSKDAGKKLCAINKLENTQMVHSVIDGLLMGEDKETL